MSGPRAMHCHTALGAVGSGTLIMHRLAALGQWAVDLLLSSATLVRGNGAWNFCNALPRASGQGNSCNALPHCRGAVGCAIPAMQRHTAWGRWAVELEQCVGPPAGGTGRLAQEAGDA